MSPLEFLESVWPEEGFYALATPFKIPGSGATTFTHKTFQTIEGAARYVEQNLKDRDMFFAVHSLTEEKVWNPNKPNYRTGELGAFESRTQTNMSRAKAFFFDLDVGLSTARAAKYSTQEEALSDLIRFCKITRLPKPMVVTSGGGLHIYWLLTEAIPSLLWKAHAGKLRQLAKHHGLRADPARTTDTASVLRVAGSLNLKDRANPRPVAVLRQGAPTPNEEFLKALTDTLIEAGVDVKSTPTLSIPGVNSVDLADSNLDEPISGPPVSLASIVTACGQVRGVLEAKGAVSEPEWYHFTNLMRFVDGGSRLLHKIAATHPGYTGPGWLDGKIAQLEAKGIGPTTCATMAEVCGDTACESCPFSGRVKSPIVAARFEDLAPPPFVLQTLGDVVHTVTTFDPPPPYKRLKTGEIIVNIENTEGDKTDLTIYDNDLFPLRRVVNRQNETEQQMWRAVLPRGETSDFLLDSDALYDQRKFVTVLANHGIYPRTGSIQHLRDYMIAYIAKLQQLMDAEVQSNHLGWGDDKNSFVLPDKILRSDGAVKPTMLSLGATRATAQVKKEGSLAKQVDLLRFYGHPAYLPHQFYVLASLAAPIFYATGHHGVVVNASGDAGVSKSTALYTGASLWGHPSLYPLNGTNNGATMKGRNERVATLANLPICVDEITHMPVKDAVDLAMSITQPGHRVRLDTSGVERASTGSEKSTVMICNGNNSLHSVLSIDNSAGTAGSMRVVEVRFAKPNVHTKEQADVYLDDLGRNYGHVGEAFVAYVIQHRADVERRVRAKVVDIDQLIGTDSSERFWSALIATVVVAGEIAHSLGLLVFDALAIQGWAISTLVPNMRGVIDAEYATPLTTLTNYLEHIQGDMMVLTRSQSGNIPNILRAPRGPMLAHYDIEGRSLWVLKKGFKDYCARTGAPFFAILDSLAQPIVAADGSVSRVVAHKHTRKVLGSGTEYAKAQSWCFVIDMAHPDITGDIDVKVLPGGGKTSPARGNLSLVN